MVWRDGKLEKPQAPPEGVEPEAALWGQIGAEVLAARYKGEAVLSPEQFIAYTTELDESPSTSAEGRARLARLAGLIQLFDTSQTVPSLRVRPDVGPQDVSHRIAEILEDAYLLEASHLRRTFGLKQNIASVRRDLRKLLEFITKNR